jgi:ABC-type multidrug transport system ATPase subunit
MDSIINAVDISRQFGDFTAVDKVSLTVNKGEIFGFLGPNGSGKSTFIRMLCGLLSPSSGKATVNGFDIVHQSEQVKRSIGYMSQSFSLYRDLTVDENLAFFGEIYGLKGKQLIESKDRVISMTEIEPYLNRPSGQLSGGWKQRLALATALIHEPELIFLDEPTAGIDPVARRRLWDLLFELASNGKTLFVTTHYMDEAERCSELGYIYMSKLILKGAPADLKVLPQVCPPDLNRLSVSTHKPAVALSVLKSLPFVVDATLVEAEVHLLVGRDVTPEQILAPLEQASCPGYNVRPCEPSLEDVFVQLTRSMSIT